MTYEADIKSRAERRARLIAGILAGGGGQPENQRGKLNRLGIDQLYRLYDKQQKKERTP